MFWGEKRRGVFKIKAWEYVLVQSYLTEGESEGNSVFGTVLYSYSSEFAEARDHSIEVRPFSNWNNNNKTERLRKPSYEENETNKFRERKWTSKGIELPWGNVVEEGLGFWNLHWDLIWEKRRRRRRKWGIRVLIWVLEREEMGNII